MKFDYIIIFLGIIIVSGAVFGFMWSRNKKSVQTGKSESYKGTIERFGYNNKTPQGWGHWVLKLENRKEIFTIWPHQQQNHEEIALSKPGDVVEIQFYKNDREVVITKLKNLNFKL